jgi:hypothetical protein
LLVVLSPGLAQSLAHAGIIRPVPEAVIDNGNGTYDAVFGALNTNATTQVTPYGVNNFFTPAPPVRGQPTTFLAGQTSSVITLTFDGTPLTWTLGGIAVTVDSTGILNDPGVVMPLLDGVFDYGNGTYAASFGYRFVDQNIPQVVIPVGVSNFFSPAPAVRGQPTLFQFGTHHAVFIVPFDGDDITWSLTGPEACCAASPPTPTAHRSTATPSRFPSRRP